MFDIDMETSTSILTSRLNELCLILTWRQAIAYKQADLMRYFYFLSEIELIMLAVRG